MVWSSLAVNLIHAYDPEVLILGGGIMANADVILPAVREHVRRYAHTPWGKVRVVASELRDQAGLVAGEWLLREQFPDLQIVRTSTYDKFPFVSVPGGEQACVSGWPAIAARLNQAIARRGGRKTVLVVECYAGVDEEEVLRQLQERLKPAFALRAGASHVAAGED